MTTSLETDERRSGPLARIAGIALIVLGVLILVGVVVVAVPYALHPTERWDAWVGGGTDQAPTADFGWTTDGLTVHLLDHSSEGADSLANWRWDFGDGTTAKKPSPQHRYARAGVYRLSLQVADSQGRTDTATSDLRVSAVAGESSDGSTESFLLDAGTITSHLRGFGSALILIGVLAVLGLTGSRLLRGGWNMVHPAPDRVKIKLRPKELDLRVEEAQRQAVQPEGQT